MGILRRGRIRGTNSMAYSMGAMVGGVIAIYLLTRLVLLVFRDKKHEIKFIIISAVVALAIATVLGGFGFADGNQPDFVLSFSMYVIPTVLVVVIEAIRVKLGKSKDKLNQEDSS
jgi:uncharacterized membrane protein